MALSNLDRVNKGLELLREGIFPFVVKELKAKYDSYWQEEAINSFPAGHHSAEVEPEEWDVQALLLIMWKQWNEVFKQILGFSEKAIVSELMEIRKRSAHQTRSNFFTTDDAYRALDNVERLLSAIASPEAEEASQQKSELLRIRFEESARKKARKLETQILETQTPSGLPAWRNVITPHPDVASGKYQQAEFAADLWRVYKDSANAKEYGNPIDFYQRTYLTQGLRNLLINSLKRINGTGGDPVINLQTNFGGGKTHSLLALYHLYSGADFSSIRDLEDFFKENDDLNPPKTVNKAIIVGNRITPGIEHTKTDGTIVRTLWGEIAWQLGGAEGFEIIKDADAKGKNPGDLLGILFKKYSPCIILIDEWVAYVRQLEESGDPIGGTYGTHITFAQAISEEAAGIKNCQVIISLPESDIEQGGERGRVAVEELRNVTKRTDSPWSAATTEEAFEIVTRRLFTPIIDKESFAKRDTIARAFSDFYNANQQEFPREASDSEFEKRIRNFFPIHPELFDRLAEDWASIDKFQKTRGILRLMAKIIHSLWASNDQSPLILPAHIPIDNAAIQEEMMHYLNEPWRAVIHKDVDGTNSLPRQIDAENPNLGRFSATRRVARTMFFSSAPTYDAGKRGVDEKRIKLGSILPGETVATFGDALRHLTNRATYVYVDSQKYWYSTQTNVNRTAEERAAHISDDDLDPQIFEMLGKLIRPYHGQISKVHILPKGTNDIPDDKDLKLIVLSDHHVLRQENTPALDKAKEYLLNKGTSHRLYRNTLIFLAPDKTRIAELKQSISHLMAWESIKRDKEILNLDVFQSNQVDNKIKEGKDTVERRFPETFIWIITPFQEPGSTQVNWDITKMNGNPQDPMISRITKKMVSQSLLYKDFAPSELKILMDKIPLWRGDYVQVSQLEEDFAKYLYLPKLVEGELLVNAIRAGVNLTSWLKDSFAYADFYDESESRYKGLIAGAQVFVSSQSRSVLVKPEIAQEQFKKEAEERSDDDGTESGGEGYTRPTGGEDGEVEEGDTETANKTRFYSDVSLSPIRFFRDAENIEKEILKHLAAVKNTNIKITLHIEADAPEGFTDDIERTIKENGNTLGFNNVEFE